MTLHINKAHLPSKTYIQGSCFANIIMANMHQILHPFSHPMLFRVFARYAQTTITPGTPFLKQGIETKALLKEGPQTKAQKVQEKFKRKKKIKNISEDEVDFEWLDPEGESEEDG
jgi:hypothetical protein